MGGRGPKVATASVEIVPDFSRFRSQVERQFRRSNLRNQIKGELAAAERTMSERLKGIGDKMTNVGSAMTKGITLPIAAIGGISLKTAIDFETAFAGVRKTVDATEKQFASLERGIRDMAVATGTSASGLASIAEAAGALGVPTDDILEFVDVVNKLDIATNLTAEDAATALGKLQNVLGLTSDDFERLASSIVDLGNTGASTESEIVDMALRIAGTAKTVGLTTAEIVAFSAAAADAGIAAERGGTAISKTFQDIAVAVAEGGKDLKGFAKIAGTSVEEFVRLFEDDPARATAAFIDGLRDIRKEAGAGGVIKALKALGISETRQIDTLQLLANAQNGVVEKIEQSTKAYQEATAAQTEFDKFQKTNKVQIDKLKAALSEVALELGQQLIPVLQESMPILRELIGYVGDAVEWFGKLDPGTQGTLVKLALGLAAFGPALRVLGPGVRTLGSLVGWLGKLGQAKLTAGVADDIAGIGTAAGGSNVKVRALARGLGILSAAIVGFEVGTKVSEEFVEPVLDDINNAQTYVEDMVAAMQARLITALADRGVDVSGIQVINRALNDMRTEGELTAEVMSILFENLDLLTLAAEFGIDITEVLEGIADGGKYAAESIAELREQLEALSVWHTAGGPADLVIANTAGGRAAGGPVIANRAYVVGEAGPELFVPSQNGDIVPNGGFSKKTEMNFGHITVMAQDVDHFLRQIDQRRRLASLAGR